MHQVWRIAEYSDSNLVLACTEHGLVLGRTPLIERRDGRFVVREASEIGCLLRRAYGTELSLQRLMKGLDNVAIALNANDPGLARIAAVHLRIPDLPDQATRDDLEKADILLKSGDWNPALHPRSGTPPNPGWFAPSGGANGGLSENLHEAAVRSLLELLLGQKPEDMPTGGAGGGNLGWGGYGGARVVVPETPRVNSLQSPEETPSLDSILAPNKEPIGYVHQGATANIRTVSPAEFDAVRSKLLSGAVPVSGPATYAGQVFERPDGSLIGIRRSGRFGITIDVIRSASPVIDNGFRIHQK